MKLTDGSRALLKLQRANLERSSPLLSTNTHVSIERLLWGEDLETHAQGAWDIVLGADVTYAYDPNAHDALAATFAALLDVAYVLCCTGSFAASLCVINARPNGGRAVAGCERAHLRRVCACVGGW